MRLNIKEWYPLLIKVWVVTMLMAMSPMTVFGQNNSEITQLVTDLYLQYNWVVTPTPPSALEKTPLSKASLDKLQEVFTPDLAEAIWEDAQTAMQRGESGVLDFDILFDSQDPFANELEIKNGLRDLEALVCFKEYSGKRKCLTIIGSRISGQLKITDIVYEGRYSLRKLLMPILQSSKYQVKKSGWTKITLLTENQDFEIKIHTKEVRLSNPNPSTGPGRIDPDCNQVHSVIDFFSIKKGDSKVNIPRLLFSDIINIGVVNIEYRENKIIIRGDTRNLCSDIKTWEIIAENGVVTQKNIFY